jgi:branched-chain amino acid transport system permease protein
MIGTRVIWIIGICLALCVPLFAGGYVLYLLSLICAYGLIAVGLNLLIGSTGLISLGHSGFVAIGAYSTAVIVDVLHFPYEVGVLASLVFCGAAGVLVALPAIRLKGFYLAIATLAFGNGVERAIYSGGWLTGGSHGLITGRPSFFGYSFTSDISLYYLCLAFALAGVWLLTNLMDRRPGRMIGALRDNELAAIAMGVDPTRIKIMVFALSALYAGLGGVLYAALLGFVSTDQFTIWLSISFIAMIVIGGLGSIAGSFIGAVFAVLVPEILRGIGEYQQIVYGLAMIGVFMLWPTGLIGVVRSLTGLFIARATPHQPLRPTGATAMEGRKQ